MAKKEHKTAEQVIHEGEIELELFALRNLKANIESGIFVHISPELMTILQGRDFTGE